jgi:uncharacterized protein (DUF1501 family)
MLTIFGKPFRHCDGVTRREFLTAGAITTGGLTLAHLLQAEAAAGIHSSHKAVINIHLDGGPPHLDMIDLKPEAPAEIRGEFTGIRTTIPGFSICELMPKLAANAKKLVFIRSLVGAEGAHNAFQCLSGYREMDLRPIGGWPVMGAVLTKLRGVTGDAVPSFVDLMQGRPLVRNSARPGFLGPSYQPFRPDLSQMFSRPLEEGMKKELAALGAGHTNRLTLSAGLSAERLHDRAGLRADLDQMRRAVDARGMMDALDKFSQQAVGILTSGRFADAMDLSKEDPRSLAEYTVPEPTVPDRVGTSEGAASVKKFLLARRLIEAGVRYVSITLSDFDTHSHNFPCMRRLLPLLDHGLSMLLTDLERRGMLKDVLIVAWGEFGRTPLVDAKSGGRHHWPRVGMALLAGGGLRTGQVLGQTDKHAGMAVERPIHYKDIFATLYHSLGIDARNTQIADQTGRPHFLLDQGEPIHEVVG